MRLPVIALTPLAFLASTTSVHAQTGPWTVSDARGDVVIRDGDSRRNAYSGARLPAGTLLTTGEKSSAILVRGREFVTLRANSQIRIPAVRGERSVVQVIQDFGSALFDVGKQKNPHFGVDTPYLAAVVKGTTFAITVGAQGATLQVTEGVVEVATLDGEARDLVFPGSVALVEADDSLRLVIEGEERRVIDSPARREGVPAQPTGPGGLLSSQMPGGATSVATQ